MGKSTHEAEPVTPTYIVPQHIISDPNASLIDLYDWSAMHNAECTLFRYAEDGIVRNLPWKDVNDALPRFARATEHEAMLLRAADSSISAPP